MTTSLTRLAAAAGGVALALSAAGAAAADPDQDPAVNTTCSYSQVVAAMNAQSPETAAQFEATPMAKSFLQNFLASPAPQREEMLQQAQGVPEAAQFVNMVGPIAKTCDKY
ncbi:hemophore-related protein [Mycobacterium sp. CSUR Q5927]|nr:hemophore-related protein [Mycobacterium sp. CSUR Q5927]